MKTPYVRSELITKQPTYIRSDIYTKGYAHRGVVNMEGTDIYTEGHRDERTFAHGGDIHGMRIERHAHGGDIHMRGRAHRMCTERVYT